MVIVVFSKLSHATESICPEFPVIGYFLIPLLSVYHDLLKFPSLIEISKLGGISLKS